MPSPQPNPHPKTQAGKEGASRGLWAWRALLILLGLLYLLQLRSPLRLGVDAVVLMSEGESVARGTGFLDHGVKTPFPPGYPAVLALLLKLGIAHAAVLIVFNLILLAIGLVALSRLLHGPLEQSRDSTLQIVCAFLLSYVVIKHTAMPLTDVPYFGLSVTCLALLTYAERLPLDRRFYFSAFAAGLVFLGALSFRMVGVSLLPALFWAGLSRKELRQILPKSGKAKAAGLIAAVLVILPIGLFRVWNYTTEVYRVAAKEGTPSAMARAAVANHGTEIGELAVNIPQRQLPALMQIVPLFVLGVGIAIAILAGFVHRRHQLCSVDIYLVFYLGIILVWPYRDPRFWLPILPFVMAYSRIGLLAWLPDNRWRPLPPFLWSFKAAFALAGLAALVYTTRLSFSGPSFPNRYATGAVRASYCAALNTCAGNYDQKEVDPKFLHVLQTFK